MSDAADRLAQALRDLITEAVEAAVAEQQPSPPSTAQSMEMDRDEPGSRKQVAERLNIPVGTPAAWASEGRGPTYSKFGRWTR